MMARDPESARDERPLWVCPRCGARLVQRNLWHSCGPWTVEGFLEGRGDRARELFDAFVALVLEAGPFTFAPAKTRVGFMVRVRFSGVTSLSDRGMTCGFWLKRRIDSPRFTKVEHLERDDWIYAFRVTEPAELADEVRAWVREAYDVGRQTHRRR